MKTIKLNDTKLKIQPPKASAFQYETSENLLKQPFNILLIGRRGSAKSTSACNYLRMLKQDDNCDRILCISSTFSSNKALMEDLDIDDEDVFDPDDVKTIDNVLEIMDNEAEGYENYLKELEIYKQVMKMIHSDSVSILDIPPEYLLKFASNNYQPPTYKYHHQPRIIAFVDDAQSTRLFGNRKFINMCVRHRHCGMFSKDMGGALGLSLLICVQNFSSAQFGLPRAVRNNATALCLFKIYDTKEMENVFKSVSGEIPLEEFMEVYDYATKEKYCFLLIDLNPKDAKKKHRKCFDELIVPNGNNKMES